jgi:hypothetical protein
LYKFLYVILSEVVLKDTSSGFNRSVKDIAWSKQNHMNINLNQNKDMIVGSKQDSIAQPLQVEGRDAHRVESIKTIELFIGSNSRWDKHAEFMCSKALQRRHCLKAVKRSGLENDELLYFSVPQLELSLNAHATNLTVEETDCIEDGQKKNIVHNI